MTQPAKSGKPRIAWNMRSAIGKTRGRTASSETLTACAGTLGSASPYPSPNTAEAAP
jgi:hypothetical protein